MDGFHLSKGIGEKFNCDSGSSVASDVPSGGGLGNRTVITFTVTLPRTLNENIQIDKKLLSQEWVLWTSVPQHLMLTGSGSGLTPVHFFSHGSTRMIEADTTSGKYWRKCGEEAVAHSVKGVIIIGAHWESLGDKLEAATNPNPEKTPCPFVDPKIWTTCKPNPDISTAERCIKLLAEEGYNVSGNSTTEWHHDVFMVLIRMFPEVSTCPPTNILSTNARYDPHYHVNIGATPHRL